jgi:Mn-dependent DtxR family transcriptional regulator
MQLHESAEMYLETIYILTTKRSEVRSIDVAQHLGYSKPSVSRAVSLLKQGGFVTTDEDGFLSLTDDGMRMAKKIFERHTVLQKLLVTMGVSEETAAEDACKIEHVISEQTLDAIKKYMGQKQQ